MASFGTRHKFNSQNSHGSSQPSASPAPWNLDIFYGKHQTGMGCSYIHPCRTCIHINFSFFSYFLGGGFGVFLYSAPAVLELINYEYQTGLQLTEILLPQLPSAGIKGLRHHIRPT